MRGYFESVTDLATDAATFHQAVLEHATEHDRSLPCFLLAHSTGCLQALELAADEERRALYSGVTMVSPFFAFNDMDEAQRQVSLMKAVSYFVKTANVRNFKPAVNHRYFYSHWLNDELVPLDMPMKSHVALFEAVTKIQDNIIYSQDMRTLSSLSHLPLLFLLGHQDFTADPAAALHAYKRLATADKNIIEYDECDHFVLGDGEWVDFVVKDIAAWQDIRG